MLLLELPKVFRAAINADESLQVCTPDVFTIGFCLSRVDLPTKASFKGKWRCNDHCRLAVRQRAQARSPLSLSLLSLSQTTNVPLIPTAFLAGLKCKNIRTGNKITTKLDNPNAPMFRSSSLELESDCQCRFGPSNELCSSFRHITLINLLRYSLKGKYIFFLLLPFRCRSVKTPHPRRVERRGGGGVESPTTPTTAEGFHVGVGQKVTEPPTSANRTATPSSLHPPPHLPLPGG